MAGSSVTSRRRTSPSRSSAGGLPASARRPMTALPSTRPRLGWVAPALLPALNLALALALAAVVIVLLGENPVRALRLLVTGAFGNAEALGYTLYYATSFIFTGLAVA